MTQRIVGEQAVKLLRGDAKIRQIFDAESLDALADVTEIRDYGYHDVVLQSEHAADHVGYVLEGALAMQKTLPDGRVHFVGILAPTDLYGRLFNGPLHYDLISLGETRVAAFEKTRFEALISGSPALERRFLLDLLDELDAAREWIILLGGHKVSERVASFLMILYQRIGAQSEHRPVLKIPIKRVDLAHYLGVRHESISRALHELERAGVIELIDAYTVEILDMSALRDASSVEFDGDWAA